MMATKRLREYQRTRELELVLHLYIYSNIDVFLTNSDAKACHPLACEKVHHSEL